ncbi:MAG TPA: Fe-S cluster assembly protein SufD [bacterium]|nr:Fe-S cluster assembly protein SufD [bacterium]
MDRGRSPERGGGVMGTVITPPPRKTAAAEEQALALHAALAAQDPGAPAAWLGAWRAEAIQRFVELGYPTTRDEDWRLTPLGPALKPEYRLATPDHGVTLAHLAHLLIPGARIMVIVNGHFDEALSAVGELPDGCGWGSLTRSIEVLPQLWEPLLGGFRPEETGAFELLNAAFWRGGAFLYLAEGVQVPEPFQVLHITAAAGVTVSHPRTVLALGAASRATVIHHYLTLGPERSLTNAVTLLDLSAGAALEQTVVQQGAPEDFCLASTAVHQDAGSHLTSHGVILGGALVRDSLRATLQGEGAGCDLDGLFFADGSRHVDLRTTIDHAVPHCTSRQAFKGILDGQARGVFTGRVIVRPGAQKTDAQQSNHNLLLSDGAQVDTQPQLEIYADDVKCSHGATIGQLDEDALFYLQSRGLGAAEARAILTYAFAAEELSRISPITLRAKLAEGLVHHLTQGLPVPPGLTEQLVIDRGEG